MKQHLNYQWSFKGDYQHSYLNQFPSDKEIVNIPHNPVNVPYNYFDDKDYQKTFSYEKFFDVDTPIKDKSIILHFSGFMLQADIYLNKEHLGHFVSGYNPIDIDITSYVKQQNNRLVVILDSKEDPLIPPFGYAVDYLTFAGIYREVYLNITTKTYIKDIFVKANALGNIEVSYTQIGDFVINVKHIVLDQEGHEVLELENDKGFLEDNHLWSITDPYLYTLKTIVEDGDVTDIIETRFGFRDIEFKVDGFYLNGEHIKLLGLNRHQLYPNFGGAAPKSLQISDADKLKELGINVVRTSHYPQSQYFLDRCDEIGLLVVNEIPGWQHISKESSWREQYYENVRSMVITHRNHPSCIAHGVRIDESADDHDLYTQGNKIAHDLDPTRPTIGVRNTKNSELLEDIYGYNDFSCKDMSHGLDDPKTDTKEKKPVLVTEYMGHVRPDKATSDTEIVKEVALRHARIIDDMYKYDNLSGCIGWCFVDYYTHVDFGSGDHICPHGVMDMYRNPKYASYVYKAQQDEVPVLEVLTNMKPGDAIDATYQDIYVVTNADKVELYINDLFVDSFTPDRENFKYMKHPPVLIDNLVSPEAIDMNMKGKDKITVAKVLSIAGIQGFEHLDKKTMVKVGIIAGKYHLKWDDLVNLWNEHVAAWGGKAKTFTFKAIKDDEVVATRTIGPSTTFKYLYKVSKTELVNEETYDASEVHIQFVDEYNNIMRYANNALKLEVSGPIELMGPSLVSTLGGQVTIYIKSKQETGKGKLTITSEREVKEIEFEVK